MPFIARWSERRSGRRILGDCQPLVSLVTAELVFALSARTYVDDAENYHGTDSFSRDDLPLVAKAAAQTRPFSLDRLAGLKSEPSE